MRFIYLVLTFSLCTILSTSAFAQSEMNSKSAVEWKSVIVPRINPLGFVFANEVSYRLKLYESESDLLKNNFVQVAAQPWFTPSWFRPGLRLDLQPLSILKLSLLHEYTFHFGTFGIIQSFETPDADYSDARLDIGKEAGEDYTPLGQQTTFAALLQAKVGPVAVRNNAKLSLTNYDLRDGDEVFYAQFLDILAAQNGWVLVDDVDLLFLTDFGLIAGIRYTATKAFYEGGESATSHRIGPLVTYKFVDKPNALLSEVSGIFLANWWLKNKYRTGEETSQAIPYLAIGLKLGGRFF